MQHLAIFGGTFNPVHNGHCAIAEAALSQFGLDRVIWVPAYIPPHKNRDMPAFNHRLAMVQRAIDPNPAFILSSIDQERQGASYAIDTLQDLQILYPNAQWYWILGMDSFQTLPRWYSNDRLAAACTWLVAPRSREMGELGPESDLLVGEQVARQMAGRLRWHRLSITPVEISSSLVRKYCREGRSIRSLVPDAVRIYIETQKLYTK